MVRVTDELALSPDAVTLYHASDPLLGHLPVLAFHGPSTTANITLNSSRIQVHIYSPAGFQSFPRLTVSPSSNFYSVVTHLPREFQGDEICRGLAFALYKYFSELPESVKSYLRAQYPTTRGRRPGSAPDLFGEQHAADLAKAMACVETNFAEHLHALECALQPQHVSNIDLDIVLPPGTISLPSLEGDHASNPDALDDNDEDAILDPTLRQYDPAYTPLIKLFGEPVFLPTSKLRRAPSRPSSLNHRTKAFTKDQKVELRMQMGELVDTEERYVLKLNELVKHIADDFRQKAKAKAKDKDKDHSHTSPGDGPSLEEVDRLFPRSADRILQINTAFMQDLRRVMDDTEEDAVRDLDIPYTYGSASSRTMHMHSGSGSGGYSGGNSGSNGGGGSSSSSGGGGSGRTKDPSGALAMAKTFLEWFPKFTDCYQDYIRASQSFPQLLSTLLDNSQSSFREQIVQNTGEQMLRSILIEPVQRLPRYSLFIDQIIGCLPITHPALQLMLKARDIITNICSMDDPLENKPHIVNRLRNLIESWPTDLEPRGRLVLAADFIELSAPYDADAHIPGIQDRAGLFLLFSDCLIVVKKKAGTTFTGRDLLREIDKPSPAGLLVSMTNAAGGPGMYDFAFSGWHQLADVRFTESADGRLVWMTSTKETNGAHSGDSMASKAMTSRCFVLQETFDFKAARWGEDIVKARIEGRFSESERETPTWTLRSVRLPENNNMGLHAAVFQEAAEELIEGRREPAPVRVVFDNHRGTKGAPVGHYGVEIVVEVRTDASHIGTSSRGSYDNGEKRLLMNTIGLNGKRYADDIAQEDFLPTLCRRIIQLMSIQHNPSNPKLVPALVSYHTKTLRSLNFSSRSEKTKSFLGSSPVKLLSNFLGGGGGSTSTVSGNTSTAYNSNGSTATNNGSSASAVASTSATNLTESIYGSMRLQRSRSQSSNNRQPQGDSASLNGSIRDRTAGAAMGGDVVRPENPLVRLEHTFTGYVAALQARKGQFVARSLLSRSSGSADELSVNLLYNRLNESPYDWEAALEMMPEVVFAAFEKFTRIAWREQMGTIMTIQALDALQERAVRKVPGDFADFVNYLFADMAPQNRRAFTALIKLLADLLDGCRDDGDRGALTLAFAELLVAGNGEPHNYINLLDRLVEDCDRIFEEIGFGAGAQLRSSAYESLNSSIARSHKSATGSVTSNTSSLRRKFGLESLLRQNSSSNRGPESMVSSSSSIFSSNPGGGSAAAAAAAAASDASSQERQSMWRSLSKHHHRHPATGESSSLTRAAAASYVSRSRSIDMGQHAPAGTANKLHMRRPPSRDRPPISGAFDDMSAMQRPPSSHRPNSSQKQLETIGEPDVAAAADADKAGGKSSAAEKPPRRKRRSSLSDLKGLMATVSLEDGEAVEDVEEPVGTLDKEDKTLPPVPLRTTKTTSEKVNSVPHPSSPSKIPASPPDLSQTSSQDRSRRNSVQLLQMQLPSQPSSSSTVQSPQQKENMITGEAAAAAAAAAAGSPSRSSPVPFQPGHRKSQSTSSYIPTLKTGRLASTVLPPPASASPTRHSHFPPPSPTKLSPGVPGSASNGTSMTLGGGSTAPQRLRLQSPQKLRERLQLEKRAVEEADASLRSELSRISEDMAKLNNNYNNYSSNYSNYGAAANANGTAAAPTQPAVPASVDLQTLAAAVQALEARLARKLQEVTDRHEALQYDMEASVKASEVKVRAIDQMYKEATAENELLYEKFNTELGKIVRALKGKGREDKEELVAKLREQTEETARLKKENARLRREAVSLRTLLKGEQQN
ncbi:MAG: hypothetical protein STHCBS139747_005909 [Sporothrix thermara]